MRKIHWLAVIIIIILSISVLLLTSFERIKCGLSNNIWRSSRSCCCVTSCFTTMREVRPDEPDPCECCMYVCTDVTCESYNETTRTWQTGKCCMHVFSIPYPA